MDKQKKGERLSHRKRRAEHKKALLQRRPGDNRRRTLHFSDLVLALVIVAIIVFLIYGIRELLPMVRSIFNNRYTELTFTIAMPTAAIDAEDLPREGDQMLLLEASKGGTCTVTRTVLSVDGETLFVTLKKENVRYREGLGYEIEDVRIAVGATADFFLDADCAVSAEIVSFGEWVAEATDAN